MTTLRKGISAAPNRRVAAVATALWAVVVGRVAPVRADDVNPTRRAEDCPPTNTKRPQAGGYKKDESLIARQVKTCSY